MFARFIIFSFAMSVIALSNVQAQENEGSTPEIGKTLGETCNDLPVRDACNIIIEATKMIEPSYIKNKKDDSQAAFKKIDYDSQYFKAKKGFLQPTIDVFFASKKKSNRLFIIITGTESARDWVENAKFKSYTNKYEDGQFYVPPAHAGFRRGMLSIINSDIFRLNEFDAKTDELRDKCDKIKPEDKRRRFSKMVHYLCENNVSDGSENEIETIIVGHSRGSGIGQVIATVVDGYELREDKDRKGRMTIERQENWPLSLHAVIGFAPPYAIHDRVDNAENTKNFPKSGIKSHWKFLRKEQFEHKTILFVNNRDIVPLLNAGISEGRVCGEGRQFGHRYLINRNDEIVYEGMDWGKLTSISQAHSSAGYARAILGEPSPPELECKPSN